MTEKFFLNGKVFVNQYASLLGSSIILLKMITELLAIEALLPTVAWLLGFLEACHASSRDKTGGLLYLHTPDYAIKIFFGQF